MGTLEYRIQSSNKYNIYKVRFEGEGENLRAFCTCPAFKKAGLFCKHVAFLLNGDDKLLIEPSDKIEELKKISENSELLEKAKLYFNPDKKHEKYVEALKKQGKWDEEIKNIKGLEHYISKIIEGTDYYIKSKKRDNGSEYLNVCIKENINNKLRQKKLVRLEFYGSHITVNGQSYGYIETASVAFIEKVKYLLL